MYLLMIVVNKNAAYYRFTVIADSLAILVEDQLSSINIY